MLYAKTAHTFTMKRTGLKMPIGPKGEKRPANVIGNAVKIVQIATGEVEDDGKDPDGKAMGAKGGKARAAKLTPEERVSEDLQPGSAE